MIASSVQLTMVHAMLAVLFATLMMDAPARRRAGHRPLGAGRA